jgi:tryptophan-rich sensory protein
VWSWFHGAAILVGPLFLAVTVIHALGVAGLHWLPVLVRSLRRGWLVIAAAVVAPLIGPLGWTYYAQASRIQEAANLRLIEWSPPDANSGYVWLALALVGAWAFSLVRLAATSGRVWRTFRMDMLLVILTVLAMTSAGRYLGLGVLLLAPLVARRLAQVWTRPPVRIEVVRPRVAVIVLGVVCLLAVGLTVLVARHVRPVTPEHPLRVWTALADQPGERRVFVDYALGGEGGLLGDVVVSIDGRADRYGGAVIDANRDFIAGRPGWQETLADYPGTTDVVTPANSGIADRLAADGWRVACEDRDFVWLVAPGIAGDCPA